MEQLPKVLNRGDLVNNLDKRVILCGSPTNFPLQHPMGHFMNYPHTAYIDLEDGTQIPVYLKTKISQKIPVEIIGRLVIISAPGPEGTKATNGEYQLVAENWSYSK